jgi:2-keto-4-pentenoate hydratase/2-oxohepta-3-ene-1,7-dioic acid hydratase in catechol pathway
MIFSFDQIISYISKYYTLRAGDLIYTGTPSGVGKVEIGDCLSCFINGREMLKVNIK